MSDRSVTPVLMSLVEVLTVVKLRCINYESVIIFIYFIPILIIKKLCKKIKWKDLQYFAFVFVEQFDDMEEKQHL